MSEIVKVDERRLKFALEYAVRLILTGKVVAFPTDTFYGLGVDPFNLAAVSEIFRIKRRSYDRPLPLLVASLDQAADLAIDPPSSFFRLAEKFWPGPLTIIVPASRQIPLKVTGNTGRLAMRQSRAPVGNALLEKLDQPLISTSANISGSPTCRSGIEVFGVMDGRVDLVLDGGSCGGAGATTIDITEPWWRVIREGGVPAKEIAEVLKGQ